MVRVAGVQYTAFVRSVIRGVVTPMGCKIYPHERVGLKLKCLSEVVRYGGHTAQA